jgi:hypothetical protein
LYLSILLHFCNIHMKYLYYSFVHNATMASIGHHQVLHFAKTVAYIQYQSCMVTGNSFGEVKYLMMAY